jgi:hypothetical protein
MATTTTDKRRTASTAQVDFRRSIEKSILEGTCADFDNDWTDIKPIRPAKVDPSFFYIKPLAVFAPHLMKKVIPDYLPCCPKCETGNFVDLKETRFVENPKPLFGMGRERELHTVRYVCKAPGKAKHTFVAHNEESLRLGGHALFGVFRFYVAKRFAVDDALYHFLCRNMYTPVAKLSRDLTSVMQQKYVNDLIEYYTCAMRGTVKLYNKSVPVSQHDRNQPSVRAFAVARSELPPQDPRRKQKEAAKKALDKLQSQLSSATKNADDPIQLKDLASLKRKQKNDVTIRIGSIGPAKLRELITEGFVTAKQFVAVWRSDKSDRRIVALLNKGNVRDQRIKVVEGWAVAFEAEFATRHTFRDNLVEQSEEL